MNVSSQVSACATLAGGLAWTGFGVLAAAGRVRPPRSWSRLGTRWGWCQVLLGAGIACFPADALLGNYSAPVLSFAGAALTIAALVVLLRGPRHDELGDVPPDDSPTDQIPPLSGPQHASPARPHAPRHPAVPLLTTRPASTTDERPEGHA